MIEMRVFRLVTLACVALILAMVAGPVTALVGSTSASLPVTLGGQARRSLVLEVVECVDQVQAAPLGRIGGADYVSATARGQVVVVGSAVFDLSTFEGVRGLCAALDAR